MNEAAYNAIIEGLRPAAAEIGLKISEADGVYSFTGDQKALRVSYNESAKLFELHAYDLIDGKLPDESRVISSWLFDDAHGIRDARSIAADFAETARGEFGVKPQKTKREVALPGKGTPGSAPDPSALAQKFLALFPAYKDTYKAHVEKYGEFLYEDFFSACAAPKLRELLAANSKKQLEKYIAMLEEVYVAGNLEVSGLITLTIIAGAVGTDNKLWETLGVYLEDKQYLKTAANAMIRYARQKKFFK